MNKRTRRYIKNLLIAISYTFCAAVFPQQFEVKAMDANSEPEVETEVVVEEPIAETVKVPREAAAKNVVEVKSVEIVEEVVEVEAVEYFNVPLSEDLQDHIFKLCEGRGIDPAIVIEMIRMESNYNASASGDNGRSLGLMQIMPKWNWDRMDRLGCHDLLDPYQNVTVGIDLLGELFSKGNSVEWALMAYNGGQAYANRKVSKGEVSYYATTVLSNSAKLEKEARV